ncbi:ACT domain-containing protein [Butyrivibrio sp. AE2032]|uniref:ACT domain-containing protein n=1 Tax=Butyrivibrio sp. AE2032 TaxID=1458463 RepID=UPI0005537152|nr:ACT domain-containing protein [Butyrivibrio sp. AE2032]
MTLERLPYQFTVCKLRSANDMDLSKEFCFTGRTDEEISLVCKTCDVPSETEVRDDGWKGFRITGILDFSLIGILSKIASILAENKIGIFAVSTYNTDYIFVKEENFGRAMEALNNAGYEVI